MKGAVQLYCNEIHLLCFMFTIKPQVSGVLQTDHITNIYLAQHSVSPFHCQLFIVSRLETVQISLHPLIADQICLVSSALTYTVDGNLISSVLQQISGGCNMRYQ